jgi:RIO kinase 2
MHYNADFHISSTQNILFSLHLSLKAQTNNLFYYMSEAATQIFRKLENEDLQVLRIIEESMSNREFVPKDQIAKHTNLPMDRINFTLSKLNKLGLIYQMQSAYKGHTLNYVGYDCLAINALLKAGIIEAFGKTLGVGKEADVYDALSPTGTRIAVKFHRLGRISFRQTRRKRGYTKEHASWLFQSHFAAEKEFQALRLVYKHGVSVPEPLSQNRHVIAMGMIDGAELSKYKKIQKPTPILKEILKNVRKAYLKAHVIHSDLSEYNIILKPDGHVLIIDWPQFVLANHPNSETLLERDIQNILSSFRRRFGVEVLFKEAYDYVTGKIKGFAV